MKYEEIIRNQTLTVKQLKERMTGILDFADSQGRTHLNRTEAAQMRRLDREHEQAKAHLADLEKAKAEDDEYLTRSQETYPHAAPPNSRTAEIHVTRNEHTYRLDTDRTGTKFLTDVARAQVFQQPQAIDRLARHATEMQMDARSAGTGGDVNTTNTVGVVVPQYLFDLTADYRRTRRAFADACTSHPLPAEGMVLEIPRVTTGTTVAQQSSELAESSHTSIVTDDLELNVLTASGYNTVSRQSLERGHLVEDLVVNDLFAAQASNLDSMLFTLASHGVQAVAAAGTSKSVYTSGSPTPSGLLPVVGKVRSLVETALVGPTPDMIVMRSNHYAWLGSETTTEWPLLNSSNIPVQAQAVDRLARQSAGVRGVLPNGLVILVDNNVPSDLDDSGVSGTGANNAIYVVSSTECHLFEDSAMMIRAEQPKAAYLGVQFVCYGYFAATFERYANAVGLVYGTGTVAPSGY